jgi:hypothetical protein
METSPYITSFVSFGFHKTDLQRAIENASSTMGIVDV